VAGRFKAWVCGRLLSGIVGSNPTGSWISVVSVVCCRLEVSGQAHHSSREVLPRVACLSVIMDPR